MIAWMAQKTKFTEYLFECFSSYEKTLGRRATMGEFAAHIGLSQPYTSQLMNGARPPGFKALMLLDKKYPGAYEAAGHPSPPNPDIEDDDLRYLMDVWDDISEELRQEILGEVRQVLGEDD